MNAQSSITMIAILLDIAFLFILLGRSPQLTRAKSGDSASILFEKCFKNTLC